MRLSSLSLVLVVIFVMSFVFVDMWAKLPSPTMRTAAAVESRVETLKLDDGAGDDTELAFPSRRRRRRMDVATNSEKTDSPLFQGNFTVAIFTRSVATQVTCDLEVVRPDLDGNGMWTVLETLASDSFSNRGVWERRDTPMKQFEQKVTYRFTIKVRSFDFRWYGSGYYRLWFTPLVDGAASTTKIPIIRETTFRKDTAREELFSLEIDPTVGRIGGAPRAVDQDENRSGQEHRLLQLLWFILVAVISAFCIIGFGRKAQQRRQLENGNLQQEARNDRTNNNNSHLVGGMEPEERKKYIADNLPILVYGDGGGGGSAQETAPTLSTSLSSCPGENKKAPVCAICLTEYAEGNSVCVSNNSNCEHKFHAECMASWLERHEECPCCRRNYLKVETNDVTP